MGLLPAPTGFGLYLLAIFSSELVFFFIIIWLDCFLFFFMCQNFLKNPRTTPTSPDFGPTQLWCQTTQQCVNLNNDQKACWHFKQYGDHLSINTNEAGRIYSDTCNSLVLAWIQMKLERHINEKRLWGHMNIDYAAWLLIRVEPRSDLMSCFSWAVDLK